MAVGNANDKWIFKFCPECGGFYSVIFSDSTKLCSGFRHQKDFSNYSVYNVPAKSRQFV